MNRIQRRRYGRIIRRYQQGRGSVIKVVAYPRVARFAGAMRELGEALNRLNAAERAAHTPILHNGKAPR